jgi:7-cyano-7-deazaguanine synthase
VKSVVLLSGGMDSALCLALEVQAHGAAEVCALGIHYGARHNGRELEAARAVARFYEVEFVGPWSLGFIAHTWRGSLVNETGSLSGPDTVVPYRNAVLLSLAVGYAASVGASRVVIGCNADDAETYPDCREVFLRAADLAALVGTEGRVGVYFPLVGLIKRQIAIRGAELGVPWGLTYSCYAGDVEPCGVCGACYERNRAFAGEQLAAESRGRLVQLTGVSEREEAHG